MAGSRQRDRGARGALQSQEALIYLATAVTLVVVALIIGAGIYLTRYRPPRVHVVTVQQERFNAAAVVHRGAYLITYQGQPSTADSIARDTVTVLENEALFRQRGPLLVGDVTDADVLDEVRRQLGFPALQPPAEGADAADDAEPDASATPAASGTAAAIATPTATPTADPTPSPSATPDDRDAFAQAYRDFLRLTQLSRDEFELIVRADLIEQRLEKHFDEIVGSSGPQIRLSRIRVTDFALAEVIHQQLVDGGDFAALHAEHSTGEESGEGGDLGWAALDALPEESADALRAVAVGEFSAVVTSGGSYDIFLVTEASDAQPYDDDTLTALIDRQVAQWLGLERARVDVQRDLSDGEERWINEATLDRARAIVAAASG